MALAQDLDLAGVLTLNLALDLVQAQLPDFGAALGLDQAGAVQLLIGAISASFVDCR